MSVSLEYLQRCSAECGFQVTALEKVVRLGVLAGDVTRHALLGKVLALKGGTALNLCFGVPQRLSVDLDFNYIGQAEREKMREDRPRVEEAVVALAKRSGYHVQHSKDAFAGRKLFLLYRSALGQGERIEVDLNFLFRVPFSGTETRSLWQPGELDRPNAHVVGLEELLIGKLLALLDRGAARDAWDVAHLPALAATVMASSRFRALFIAFAATLDHPLATYNRDRLGGLVSERAVTEQLAPMLTTSAVLAPKDLVEQAWVRVASLLSLTNQEEAYVAAIHQGELQPELLFPNEPAQAELIAQHPAILWKVQNVRTHGRRRVRVPNGADSNDGRDGS